MKTALTIGFFDGVHLGHTYLLQKLREHPHTTILTFSNHPLEILRPPAPPILLPLKKRLALLKPFADVLIVQSFSQEFASIPFDALLDRFELSHLLLGEGSAFGKNRLGNRENIEAYAKKKGFTAEYLPKQMQDSTPISSTRIRQILKTNHTKALELLGHTL